MNLKNILFVLSIIILMYFGLTGCVSMTPTRYGERVIIVSGKFEGKYGVLLRDCSGFESYLVRVEGDKKVCLRIWEMRRA